MKLYAEQLAIFLKIILSVILGLTCLSACSPADQCTNDILAEYRNPSRIYKVIAFDRGCGATTASSIQLSVIPIEEDLENTSGNIFIASSISGNDLKNDRTIMVSWLNDSTIKVKCDSRLNIFKKENKNGKFNIVYEE